MSAGPDNVYVGESTTAPIIISWETVASGSYDIARVTNGDIEAATIFDAVLISLLSWRPAREGDPVPPDDPKRGWWGDREFGSRLWLLQYATTRAEVPRLARDYAEEALAWMIDEGVASAVDVQAERVGKEALDLTITIARPNRTDLAYRFASLYTGAT